MGHETHGASCRWSWNGTGYVTRKVTATTVLVAALLAGFASEAVGQPLQPPPAGLVKATQADARSKAAIAAADKIGKELANLRAQLASTRGKGGSAAAGSARVKAIEARIAALEAEARRGCAAFKDVASQSLCLEVLRAGTAGTDAQVLETAKAVLLGLQAETEEKDGTTGDVKTTRAFGGQAGGRCVDIYHASQPTSEHGGTVLRIRCPPEPATFNIVPAQAPLLPAYPPPTAEQDDPSTGKVVGYTVLFTVLGAAAGFGADWAFGGDGLVGGLIGGAGGGGGGFALAHLTN